MKQNNYFEVKVKELLELESKYAGVVGELKQIENEIMPVFESMQDIEEYKLKEQQKQIVVLDLEKIKEQTKKNIETIKTEIIENFPIKGAWVRIYNDIYAAVQIINCGMFEQELLISKTKDRSSLKIFNKPISVF
jgi:hypothetical protein